MGVPPMIAFSHGQDARATGDSSRSRQERKTLSMTNIERSIHVIREHKVMLDEDLAQLYGVTTGRLNEAVKRNMSRFPMDFAFRLTVTEAVNLKSQIATSSSHGGRRRSTPMVFTEQGVAMLSSVLIYYSSKFSFHEKISTSSRSGGPGNAVNLRKHAKIHFPL